MKDVLRASYDRSAAGYDEQFRPLQRPKYAALLGADAAVLRAARGPVLDLGCGTGLLAEWMEEVAGPDAARATGLDLSHEMLRRARARGVRAVEGDLERTPFRDGAFAAVLAFTAIALFAGPGSPARALAEVVRVLAPGGTFAVTILKSSWTPGFEDDLRAAGFLPGRRRDCGQDYGWLCVRR